MMRTYPADEPVDAVVIGTGAGGAPVLARLARAGLRVIALDAGPDWRPAQDFATDERSQSKLYWNDERLSGGDDPLAFGVNNSGTGVGGSTLHYTAFVPRPQPWEFRLRSRFGVGVDWPLAYEDLERYYDEVEAFLGVSGPSPYPWGPARTPYPLPPLPLNAPAELMQRGCARLGIRTAPAPNAALSRRYFQREVGWREACTNRGFCESGCTTGAKGSTDVTFIPAAIAAGAEVRANTFAVRLERDARGLVESVVSVRDGREERQRTQAIYLCAGAVETPRFLLLNGIGGDGGQVGRNFMAHVAIQLWGRFAESTRPWKGVPGGLVSEDMNPPQDADFAAGYRIQSVGIKPLTYASQLVRTRGTWGPGFHDEIRAYNHMAGINVHGECLPYAENRIELSEEMDARGLPKPVVYFSHGANERALAVHAEALMRQIWQSAGAEESWLYARGAHTLGTARMGASVDGLNAGVVDAEGRSFEVPNLFISDGSVFPSSLSANPALTIMALSLRSADRFLERRSHRETA